MAALTDRLGDLIDREGPAWGIEPVPPSRRTFSTIDLAVLWGDLSVGLLVIWTGAFLVPGLSLPAAVGAIALGTALGCVPLALVGVAGARDGLPTMALFRPVLGVRGSYLPSAVNVVQLVGWTAFEFWAMAEVGNAVSRRAGVDAYPAWLALVAAVCVALALGGPVIVVRRWLERFGIYALLAVAAWITWRLATAADLGAIWRAPGRGGSFWLGVDLVVAMPVSWLPLVADYNRFARRDARVFAGTYAGFAFGNAWFFALGAIAVLAARAAPDVLGIGEALLALAGGAVVLAALLVGESDQAFANIYSAAVSLQNIAPRLSQRALVGGVGAVAFGIAAVLGSSGETYELFLLLIGSVFVPLFGVFAADYFAVRRGGRARREATPGVRWRAMVPWAIGFAVFHWSAPSPVPGWERAMAVVYNGWLSLPFPLFHSALGASIPSFGAAFVLSIILLPRDVRPSARAAAR